MQVLTSTPASAARSRRLPCHLAPEAAASRTTLTKSVQDRPGFLTNLDQDQPRSTRINQDQLRSTSFFEWSLCAAQASPRARFYPKASRPVFPEAGNCGELRQITVDYARSKK